MKTFNESINQYWLNFYKYINSIWVIPSLDESKETQINLLRKRYYSNLSFLDGIAKTFGDMVFFKQSALYTLAIGISASGIILANPIVFIIGVISLNFLVFIALQYRALEARFSQLVYDLAESEQRLQTAVAANVELEQALRQSGFKLNKLIEDLEAGRVEARKITQTVRENKKVLDEACELIEKSAQQSHLFVEKLGQIEADTVQKGGQCIGLLHQISEIATQALNDINQCAQNPMTQTLAEQNQYLIELETNVDDQYVRICSDSK